NHAEALAQLTRLYERTGKIAEVVELCERRAEQAQTGGERAELLHQAGELLRLRLSDPATAEQSFVRALVADPAHVPARVALVEIYRQRGELLKASKLLLLAAAQTADRLARTRMLFEASEICERLQDRDRAISLYLEVLVLDPDHREAAERAGELLWQ